MVPLAGGCRVGDDDLHRWERTDNGPTKLAAVLMHDKYELPLRVEAAMSLIRMRPRRGRFVGIDRLVCALAGSKCDEEWASAWPDMAPEARNEIVAALVPLLVAELTKDPPVAQAGQPAPPDDSFKFKDTAYRMLTFDRVALITDAELKKTLTQALIDWAMADFERRLNDRSQAFGMEQLLRFIGPDSVTELPKQMLKDTKLVLLKKMADIVAKIGSRATKEAAGRQLVEVARYVASDTWKKDKTPELKEANARSGYDLGEADFEAQLSTYQLETLTGVFASMKQAAGPDVVEYCLTVGADPKAAEKTRQTALAALEQNLDTSDAKQVDRLVAIAASDAAGIVLDQAFARLREFKREVVIDKLYDLFKTDKWKVRRSAATSVLRISKAGDAEEFLQKLATAEKNFALDETIKYGAYLGDLKSGDGSTLAWGGPRAVVEGYLAHGSVQARLTAIGYLYSFGTKNDLPKLQPVFADREKVPKCDEGADCGWTCSVPKAANPAESEDKTIATVGEYAELCIAPRMADNKPPSDDTVKKDTAQEPAPAPGGAGN